MQTYRLRGSGSLDAIVREEEELVSPEPHQIVVRVGAASLNRRDALILHGTYPLPSHPGVVPLSNGAGEVTAVGSAVSRFKVGARVISSYFPRWVDGRIRPELADQPGCTLDGMLSEYAVLDEQWAVALPDSLSFTEGATLGCAGLTAWSAVFGARKLIPGQTILTLGTGGVSLFAIQFAKMVGLRVIAVTSRDEKVERLVAAGADHALSTAADPDWASRARAFTGGRGVDLVVETGGPAIIGQSLRAAALYGHIVLLITQAPGVDDLVLPGAVYANSLVTISRQFVGSRTDLDAMVEAIDTHRLRPVIDHVFPFHEARGAYAYAEQGDLFGKVVIEGA